MENTMKQEDSFYYKYSAEENKEIEEIRRKYLPVVESKVDELKRLDAQVQNAGIGVALCVGVIGSLIRNRKKPVRNRKNHGSKEK